MNIQKWREKFHEVIFEADTPAGKTFDQVLIVAICLSILVVMLESVPAIHAKYARELIAIEWIFTFLFTLEYIARLFAVKSSLKYAKSFFGIVDLLSILPTYISFFSMGAQSLQVIRVFRLIRIFRIYKLAHYLKEAQVLAVALSSSKAKITVFLMVVISTVITMGALMYWIEGPEKGFTSIPTGVYWAIVTMTTVGYGDISPQTPLGQALASMLMIIGYGVIAVPTGIVSVEIAKASRVVTTQACPNCSLQGHDPDAKYCKYCASKL